jgi:hypothetical protein
MRIKHFWLIVLMTIWVSSKGHCAFQIADTTKTWNNLSCLFSHSPFVSCGHTVTNRFSGDTVINTNHYLKVYESADSLFHNWKLAGFLKEDTKRHKVFFRSLSGNEGLVYDFGLRPSDKVCINNTYMGFPCAVTLTCYMRDSVLISGLYRERYFLGIPSVGNEYSNRDTWIEGIGSIHGLFNSGYLGSGFSGGYSELLCCSEKGRIIYRNPEYNNCFKNDFYPVVVSEPSDTAWLDTFYEFFIHIADSTAKDNIGWCGWSLPGANSWADEENGKLAGVCNTSGDFPRTVSEINCGYTVDVLKMHSIVLFVTLISNNDLLKDQSLLINPAEGKITLKLNPNTSGYSYSTWDLPCGIEGRKTVTDSKIQADYHCLPKGTYSIRIYNNDSKTRTISY